MLKIEKVLRIDYSSLPKDIKGRIRDRYNFRNDVSISLYSTVPSRYLLGPLPKLLSYIKNEWEVSDEDIDRVGLIEMLNSDGNDGTIYELLQSNPDIREEFDSVVIDVCW